LVRCRSGLAELLADELAPLGTPRVVADHLVELEHRGTLAELFRARTAIEWGVRVELASSREDRLPAAIATALASPAAATALSAWSSANPRYRLEFAAGGHQRARVFEIVAEVAKRLPALVNDPRKASWSFVIVDDVPDPHLVLVPRGFEDPRFLYRRRDVRAASHPSIAAALARVAGVRDGDRVWDPFVGSGLELVERALLGRYATLTGSDRDPAALAAARENLGAAGISAVLQEGDATRYDPGPQTLIVTNPPMGRRLVRDATLGSLLDDFVAHAARVLTPGGRLVWLSPLPAQTRARARACGLQTPAGRLVDLGGFPAELQVFTK
jgi:precorrin-6B methylase 2